VRPATSSKLLNDEHLRRQPPGRRRAIGPDRLPTRLAGEDATRRPPRSRTSRARARPRGALYGPGHSANPTLAGFGPELPAGPAPSWSAGSGSSPCSNGAFAMGEGNLNWDGHRRIKSDLRPATGRSSTSPPPRRSSGDLKGPGAPRRHVWSLWTTEFGPDAHLPEGDPGPRPTTRPDSPPGSPGPASSGAFSYGATDEFGHKGGVDRVVDRSTTSTPPCSHLLGLDHERLTFYHKRAPTAA